MPLGLQTATAEVPIDALTIERRVGFGSEHCLGRWFDHWERHLNRELLTNGAQPGNVRINVCIGAVDRQARQVALLP